jgi:hypothetical protein
MKAYLSQALKYPIHLDMADKPHHDARVDLQAPRAGVLHTTEGGWTGSEQVFREHPFAPHFMVGLVYGAPRIEQYVPVGMLAGTCRGHNDKAIVQIEMIGFADEKLWLPDPVTLDALCSLMVTCEAEYDIPLSHPWPDGDFGLAGSSRRNTHRKSGKYGSVAGWFGHADVPDPDRHWDPGNLKWSAVFEHCQRLKGELVA